jgi:GMP synthase (glutamine-hydrolysing)
MLPLFVLKTGNALRRTRERRGDFHDWIARAAEIELAELRVANVHEGDPLPEPASISGVIVTGSPAMVTAREPWSEQSTRWLARAVGAGTPVFGICYGHQILAEALGGRVGINPRGREMGTTDVRVLSEASADPLFGSVPARFAVHTTHVESVLELPPGARRLAENDADPHHAFAFGDSAWGVQFHPEFDADVMDGYLDERSQVLREEGLDPAALRAATRECPEASDLLRRFVRLVGS